MKSIHDYGYKKLFFNKTIFRQLVETFIDQAWVKDLDFNDCRAVDKSFVSDHYKETECDILYQVKLKGKPAFVYLLIEFQSTVDWFMALRTLNYVTNFWMDYVHNHKNVKTLPEVFLIVLYNGDRKWTAPVDISNLMDPEPDFGDFGLKFRYFKIAENEFTVESLLKIRNIVSTLFLAESSFERETVGRELLAVFEREEDKQAVSLLLNWFQQMCEHGRIDPEEFKSLRKIYHTKTEVKTMLVTALERERKSFFEEGKIEGKIEVAKGMLARELEVELIADITGLSRTEIEKLKRE